jgi:hypothetical protein
MTSDHSELDLLNLTELTSRLRDVHTHRTPLGWPTDDAVTKSAIERRIVDLVTRRDPQPVDDPAHRITCELDVKLSTANRPAIRARKITVLPGSLFIETDDQIALGEPVEVEISMEGSHRLRGRGVIGYQAHGKSGRNAGLGIGFTTVVGESNERRLERLILELIKNRL